MLEPQAEADLRKEIEARITADREILDTLRAEIRPLKSGVRRIQPRNTTSISLVATDGGNNQIQFDPFLVQIIRVVDSSNNQYVMEAVTPSSSIIRLSELQFHPDGSPRTSLGKMMDYLGVKTLPELSHMIRIGSADRPTSLTWIQVYRELVEWAILFDVVRNKDFGTDTLIVFDGLLRSKAFARDYFGKLMQGFAEGIEAQYRKNRRRIYLTGVAKHSKVLDRYRLAMRLENIMVNKFPCYVEIPRDIEDKAYVWGEYARGDDVIQAGAEVNKFVGGKMFFVKFGESTFDPIWPIDIFLKQKDDAQLILGSMLADALNGFPVPLYPQCLQRAHENAALVSFDFDILQDVIIDGIREILGEEAHVLDGYQMSDKDPAAARYER